MFELAIILPDWLITILSTFGSAVLGVLGKFVWDYLMEKRQLRANRMTQLIKLRSTLQEGKQLYDIQTKFVVRLVASITSRTGNKMGGSSDAFFSSNYDTMNEDEKDMFIMIRGITSNSMKRTSDDILKWIDENSEFKTNSIKPLKNSIGPQLAQQITKLELFTNLWQDKYSVWMANEKHAFVNIMDNNPDGSMIPTELNSLIDQSIEIIRRDVGIFQSKLSH